MINKGSGCALVGLEVKNNLSMRTERSTCTSESSCPVTEQENLERVGMPRRALTSCVFF